MSLILDQTVPSLSARLAGGGTWALFDERPAAFSLLVFYRGLHCPVCRLYVTELEKMLPKFERRGIAVTALSADSHERAEQAKTDWALQNLRLAYGVPIAVLRAWGLHISKSNGPVSTGVNEPEYFGEPGLFLVRPDGRLYWAKVSLMPFVRPQIEEVLLGTDCVISKDNPAREDA